MMIGRAAIGYPWIFNEIKHFLKREKNYQNLLFQTDFCRKTTRRMERRMERRKIGFDRNETTLQQLFPWNFSF